MIPALVKNDLIEEAYTDIKPFVNRVIENNGFFEQYTIDGKPHGSEVYRGSSGALMEAIDGLQEWLKRISSKTTGEPRYSYYIRVRLTSY